MDEPFTLTMVDRYLLFSILMVIYRLYAISWMLGVLFLTADQKMH